MSEDFQGNVWLLTNDEGRCASEEFLSGLGRNHFIKMLVVMRRVDANPGFRHPERFKQLNGVVFEFKSHLHRRLCFRTDRGFVCPVGMKKQKSSRTRQSDRAIETTAQLAKRFAKEGTYDDEPR